MQDGATAPRDPARAEARGADVGGLPDPHVPRVQTPVTRLVVRLPPWLGDVVLAAPGLAALRRALPTAHLAVAVRPGLEGLAALLPGVDATVSLPAGRGAGAVRGAARALAAGRFDAALLLPRGARAALEAFLARIPVRVGFGAPFQRLLLTHPVEGWRPWRTAHRTRWFALPARAFGAAPAPEAPLPPLVVPAASRASARRLLGALGRRPERALVVLEPGAAYGPAKCWPPERFGDLARRLLARGVDVLTTGTGAARDLEQDIALRAGGGLLRGAGRTPDLAVLAGCLAQAALVVTNDTGPMHLASALGTPVLALFGATDPAVSGPAGPGPRRILLAPTPCSPCFLRTCPIPGHPCLAAIGVARVEQAACALLALA